MKVRKYIAFEHGYLGKQDIDSLLRAHDIDVDEGEFANYLDGWHWRGTFDADDPRFIALRKALPKRGLPGSPLVIETIEWSATELDAAELPAVRVTAKTRGESGPRSGNQYDMSDGCPRCRSGAKLVAPFRFASRDLPRSRVLAGSDADDILVQGALLDALCTIDSSPTWLMPVHDRETNRALPWASLQPQIVMPRVGPATVGFMHEPTGGNTGQCSFCRRDGFGACVEPCRVLSYERREVEGACAARLGTGVWPDVAATWECMGPGTRKNDAEHVRIPPPNLLVSGRVARVLREKASRLI